MSNRFRIFSWGAAIGNLLIAAVFFSTHPAMNTPGYHYVFLLFPWWLWTTGFAVTGLVMCAAIGTGVSKAVRRTACFSVVLKSVWATEFAFVLPTVVANQSVSWMGLVLVGLIAFYEMAYLGMSASKWLDFSENSEYAEVIHLPRQ